MAAPRNISSGAANLAALCLLLAVAFTAGCDTVEPVDSSLLVVEGYLETGNPLPNIRLNRTLPPGSPYSAEEAAVKDAALHVLLDGKRIDYEADPQLRGVYIPKLTDDTLSAGQTYALHVRWSESVIETTGILPPRIQIDDVDVSVPEEPVSAVFLDSLSLADTLATGAYTGYIYPVEVTIRWDEAAVENESWVRLQLKPYAGISSTVIDLFLNSDEILRERERPVDDRGRRVWTGVYAVGVPEADAPMPGHGLRIALVRSGEDYARFAASKNAPARREPITNLNGAAGIFTAVSIDSLSIRIAQQGP